MTRLLSIPDSINWISIILGVIAGIQPIVNIILFLVKKKDGFRDFIHAQSLKRDALIIIVNIVLGFVIPTYLIWSQWSAKHSTWRLVLLIISWFVIISNLAAWIGVIFILRALYKIGTPEENVSLSIKEFKSDREVNEFIEHVRKIDGANSYFAYTYIKNILQSYSIPFPVLRINKGKRLFRARPHLNGEKYFSKISEISYIPYSHLSNIKNFGRANEPGQSIFYCTDIRELAFMETSQNVRSNLKIKSEVYTTGAWDLKEDLNVMVLPNNDDIKGLNSTLESLNIPIERVLNFFRENHIGFIGILLDYFSKEFTRDVKGDFSKYKVSCAFANYIFDMYGLNTLDSAKDAVDGIMYTSVKYNAEGMNFALNPNIIDSGKIKLVSAVKMTMRMESNSSFRDGEPEDCKSIDNEGGLITWE